MEGSYDGWALNVGGEVGDLVESSDSESEGALLGLSLGPVKGVAIGFGS